MFAHSDVLSFDPRRKIRLVKGNEKSKLSNAVKKNYSACVASNYSSLPVLSSVASVTINSLSVSSISITDSEAHTSTIPASSPTLNAAGTDTLTSIKRGVIVRILLISQHTVIIFNGDECHVISQQHVRI